MAKETLELGGMSCAACASAIERLIRNVPGVNDCQVNFGMERAQVDYDPQKTNISTIEAAVERAGYEARPLTRKPVTDVKKYPLKAKLIFGGIVGGILFFSSLPAMVGLSAPMLPGWLQLILATPVQFSCGSSFYVHAWKALKNRSGTMDTLVVLGTTAAYSLRLASQSHHRRGRYGFQFCFGSH
ncbi:MAG: putative copper-transporting ATPase PacS [Chroococcopsis gigantea SAG 12.99]|jgi:Cu+-exporting ATPase|nr:cation-translocating P-type ATPase [Chlorogloea purpurea SAG 13.99]MDV2999330.1 putative copper-transporting ATPase PacS [Chroococcopsis gigantea SAG 12.99]